jgi:hypothetical protein
MAKKKVTVTEIKKAQVVIELEVLELFQAFEKKYDTFIRHLNLDRKDDKKKKNEYDSDYKGRLINVTINMDVVDLL